jgi:cell division protein FtsB
MDDDGGLFFVYLVRARNLPLTLFLLLAGLGFGLGGGGLGNSYRDYRQDDELARERAELEQARLRSAELEQRISQLEGSVNQNQPLQLQQQQPVAQ